MKPEFLIEARLKDDHNNEHLNQIFTARDKEDLNISLEILDDHYYKLINIFKRNDNGNFMLYEEPTDSV